jgi:xanthine dehydrogenase accessory factor
LPRAEVKRELVIHPGSGTADDGGRMKPSDYRVLIRGAGELASATAQHLFVQGFETILMLERRYPKAVRRQVCFSEAILDGESTVQGVRGVFARNVPEVLEANRAGAIAVAALDLEDVLHQWQPQIFIEAAMLRKNWGLRRGIAPVVIALGPGYVARKDCDAVVDTVRGPQVGAVLEDTGERLQDEPPAQIMGYADERAVKAVRDGIFFTQQKIGAHVDRGERIGTVVSVYGVEDFRQGVPVDASYPVTARISGVLRGLLRDGVPVKRGDRIADVDPRGRTDDLDHLSDKSLRVAEGVLEAVLGLIAEGNRRGASSKSRGGAKAKRKASTAAGSAKQSGSRSRSESSATAAKKPRKKIQSKSTTKGRKKKSAASTKKG